MINLFGFWILDFVFNHRRLAISHYQPIQKHDFFLAIPKASCKKKNFYLQMLLRFAILLDYFSTLLLLRPKVTTLQGLCAWSTVTLSALVLVVALLLLFVFMKLSVAGGGVVVRAWKKSQRDGAWTNRNIMYWWRHVCILYQCPRQVFGILSQP